MVINLVSGFQALGTLMVVGLMMIPAISARFWKEKLEEIIVLSIVLALFSSFLGLLGSYHYNIPSGPSIILSCGSIYIFSLLFGSADGVITKSLIKKHHHFEN